MRDVLGYGHHWLQNVQVAHEAEQVRFANAAYGGTSAVRCRGLEVAVMLRCGGRAIQAVKEERQGQHRRGSVDMCRGCKVECLPSAEGLSSTEPGLAACQ